ncbi:hypothetical protein PMX22_09965 [Clostridium butyricum]|jgi:hypothetical protein|uniref:hypothetical protein n=1 Tax=Clostridium butyricum TaxID=1492 RepID=UPI00206A155B|nr:hypothetical protein [Clostridium butyricum]MDB2160126.1 hypothetical protein [Clostridium butyricum]DAQ97658.1 MAG TPA: hypothetical protein [Caudoviricetes sp.]
MKCSCGQKIYQQLCVPNVYFSQRYKDTEFTYPVTSYEFKCPKCGKVTILSLAKFESLKEESTDETN